jgi:3-isopropylmalate/(R)-2-methylmalate dehydratase large subunit
MSASKPRTLFDKIWDAHVVERLPDGTCILYIDRHLLHEVTSPQAFEGLRVAGRKLRRPDLHIAVADHNIPTVGSRVPADIKEEDSRIQVETLEMNVKAFGVPYIPILDKRRARRWSAATAIPPPTARWARWRSVSARPRSSM